MLWALDPTCTQIFVCQVVFKKKMNLLHTFKNQEILT